MLAVGTALAVVSESGMDSEMGMVSLSDLAKGLDSVMD